MDWKEPPQIVMVDPRTHTGYTSDGQGFTPVVAGIGAIQNGPYSVIINYKTAPLGIERGVIGGGGSSPSLPFPPKQ